MFIASLFIIAKIWQQPKCPSSDEWIKKMRCVGVCARTHTHTHTHTHTVECYSAIKKNEILPFVATWIYLAGFILGKTSQIEKEKYCMLSLICEI